MKNVNMRDVAKLAGVSVATVSHVINQTKPVSKELRQKVLNSITQLGYKSHFPAPASPVTTTRRVGVIVPDIINPFFCSFYRALQPLLLTAGYQPLLACSNEDISQEKMYLNTLINGVADGIILSSAASSYSQIAYLIPEHFPILFFDRLPAGCPHDIVLINNYDAVFQGVEKLIMRNHWKIGCITGNFNMSPKQEKESAYKAALEKYGIKEYWAYHTTRTGTDVYAGTRELLDCGCTAFVAFNAHITEGIINILLRMGKNIGKDIEVLAYQDSTDKELYSLISHLSVIQPINKLASVSAGQICERIANPLSSVRQTILQAYLKENDSAVPM